MKKQTIFQKILVPLMGLVFLEIFILVSSIFGQDLIGELSKNERSIVDETIHGRKEYLQNVMINNWMNLDYTVQSINEITAEMLDSGEITLEELDDSSGACAPLITRISNPLIKMMRSNSVSGAFVIMNTEDLSGDMENGTCQDKPGIYLMDKDPASQFSSDNSDLLVLRGPLSTVQELGIAADSFWRLNFAFGSKEQTYYDFFYKPFQTALENDGTFEWEDMGYWSQPYRLMEEGIERIAYAVPLILEDGTVYGVLGIDISLKYFSTLFPYQELNEDGSSAYFIGKKAENEYEYRSVFGEIGQSLTGAGENRKSVIDQERFYVHEIPLDIYNTNTPFYEDQWVFGGIVPVARLNAFANRMEFVLVIALMLTTVIGVLGSLLISYVIQKPVASLSHEMEGQDVRKEVKLHDTGIREIDQMAAAVEKLSRNVLESDMKLTRIIKMASVRLAGFQINYEENSLFVTEGFFEIFGRPDIEEKELSVAEFHELMEEFRQYFVEKKEISNTYIYRIRNDQTDRYIQLRFLEDEKNCYGLCEDITQSALEKRILQHERDHDLLTNLYNRRAFWREVQNLFHDRKDTIRIGALLMLDLDNLKYINDTFGHEYGDRYIVELANALTGYLPENALYARISGDEFYAFVYGYDTREEVEQQIGVLKNGISSMCITLPGNVTQAIQASGGVSWYPKDSTSMEELFKYADYAMYEVKKSTKGEIRNFDMSHYEKRDEMNRSKQALNSLIVNKSVQYAFQPIVDAHTGVIFAYEALMRPFMSDLSNVGEVLETARREGKLDSIEELTWFESIEAFDRHVKEGRIDPNCRLFLNSIPNQRMSRRKEDELIRKYGMYMKQVVLELTEEERIDKEMWEGKQLHHRKLGGTIAMDDYGTGYNSEKMLLTISPEFIKVDIAIVKDIHLSSDKQAIVSYIVNYAHERGKFIIAEGVESADETRMVISLGVDYLQGYYFAKPQIVPEGISREAVGVILEMQREKVTSDSKSDREGKKEK